MYRRILISGVTAAAVVGAGGTAFALSGSDQSTSGTPSPSSTSSAPAKAGQHSGKHDGKGGKHGGKLLKRLAHGQFVVKGKDGKYETHDIIRGTVTTVSTRSITVTSADKKSQTYAITKDTKVRVRDNGKGAASTISKVAKGDQVLVAGTGTSKLTAKHVIDVKGR